MLGSTRLVAGDHGPFLVTERALRLRRILWATAAFQAEDPNLWEQIVDLSGSKGSKWRVSASQEAFLRAAQRETSKSACIVLVAGDVDPAADPVGVAMTKREFLDWLFVVNVGASSLH